MDFILSFIYISAIVFILVLITFIISKFKNKHLIANVSECAIWWLSISVILPFRAKKLGLITKNIYGWILTLISPAAIITYLFIYSIVTFNSPRSFDELPFTSRDDIALITEISDFPEFEYINNSVDDWYSIIYTRNKFKDEDKVAELFKTIEIKLNNKDNIYWYKDTLSFAEDKDFFGGNFIYIFRRGWDSQYVEAPKGIEQNNTDVEILIGNKAFLIKTEGCYPWDMEFYSCPDSLSSIVGITFPKYKIINLKYYGESIDPSWDAVLELDKKPSKTFIRSIKKADNWERLIDGRYHIHISDRAGKGDLWEDITIDPQSKFVHLSVSTH